MAAVEMSLIIPVYNGEKFLRQALESVFNQECLPAEILVVDDDSTDETPRILESFGDSIRVIRTSHGGADAARNEGVRSSRLDIIAFLDADDLALPTRFKLQYEALKRDSELDFVFGYLKEFQDGDNSMPIHLKDSQAKPGICVGTLAARKESFLKTGFFETQWKMAAFMEWYFRVQDGKFRTCLMQDVLIHRRIHDKNLTLQGRDVMAREYAEVIAARLKRKKMSDNSGL